MSRASLVSDILLRMYAVRMSRSLRAGCQLTLAGSQAALNSLTHLVALLLSMLLQIRTLCCPCLLHQLCVGFAEQGSHTMAPFHQHCTVAHGGDAEYLKQLLWRARQDGFKPSPPWVKRHVLQSASSHLTLSVPASFALHWNHPKAFSVATRRCEVACVVCDRKDWFDNSFQCIFGKLRLTHGPVLSYTTHSAVAGPLCLAVTFCALAT